MDKIFQRKRSHRYIGRYVLVLIIENVNFERAAGDERRVGVRRKCFLGWEPEVKLCQPVLERVHLVRGEIKTLRGETQKTEKNENVMF